MKNRLQFRYHSDIFFNRELAYEYLTETINNKHDERSFSSLIAEPLVAYYYDANGDTQVLFLIGVNGNGEQPVNENTNYFILDGAKMNESISELEKNTGLDHNRIVALETALQEEIDRAKKKEQDLETSVNKLVRNIESETEARRNVDGQVGPKYLPNLGTTAEPIKFISEATSLNHADMILDQALQMVENKSLTNINVNGIDGSVKNNVASVVVGGKNITLTDYTMGSNSHPVTHTDSVNSAFGKVQVQINETQKGVGLSDDGTYKKNTSSKYISTAKSVHEATEILDETIEKLYGGEVVDGMETIHKIGYAVQKEITNRVSGDEKLNGEINKNKTDITTINTYTVNNKLIKNNPVLTGTDIKLDNYIASAGVADVHPNDTVNIGLGKLETRIKNVQSNLDAEVERSTEAENVLTNNINTINNNITKINGDIIKLDDDINALSNIVDVNKVINTDGSLKVSQSTNTDLSVKIAEGDNALKLTVNGLMVDKSALTNYSGENAIVVDLPDSNNNKKISLRINSYDKVLVNDGAGLKTDISMSYEREAQRIRLYGKSIDGVPVIISEINVSDFIADSMIEDVKFDKETSILTITWNTISGQKPVEIDFSNLIDVYTAGNGLTIDVNNKFHVVVDETNCDTINGQVVLQSTANGIRVVGVKNAIDSLSTIVNGNTALIQSEVNRAKDAESSLTTEVTRLNEVINTEVVRATAIESSISAKLDTELEKINETLSVVDTEIDNIQTNLSEVSTNVETLQTNVEYLQNRSDVHDTSLTTLNEKIDGNYSDLNERVAVNTESIRLIHENNKELVTTVYTSVGAENLTELSLLKEIDNKVFASNSTSDMKHDDEVLYGVIEGLEDRLDEQKQEIINLQSAVDELNVELSKSNDRIKSLEEEIAKMHEEFEQKVIEILDRTFIGTTDEIKVTNFDSEIDNKHKIQIGFADTAIFNANTKNLQ